MRHKKYFIGCLLLLYMFSAVSVAQSGRQKLLSNNQKIELEADSIEYDYKSGTSIYRGKVVARKGNLHLTGDVMEVSVEGDSPVQIILRGNPGTFKNKLTEGGTVYIEAGRMKFDGDAQVIYMRDNVVVDYAGNNFRGSYIVYDIDKELIRAPKSQDRIRMTIDSKNQTR